MSNKTKLYSLKLFSYETLPILNNLSLDLFYEYLCPKRGVL